jgi:hypothetical protein
MGCFNPHGIGLVVLQTIAVNRLNLILILETSPLRPESSTFQGRLTQAGYNAGIYTMQIFGVNEGISKQMKPNLRRN